MYLLVILDLVSQVAHAFAVGNIKAAFLAKIFRDVILEQVVFQHRQHGLDCACQNTGVSPLTVII